MGAPPDAPPDAPLVLHGSCVAVNGRGLLILGPSGAGKSALCLHLLAYGALLVADDRTELTARGGVLTARCPSPPLTGVIEARGIGLLCAPHVAQAPVVLVADLTRTEPDRLPPHRTITISGIDLPLVLHPQNGHFPPALFLYLSQGRHA